MFIRDFRFMKRAHICPVLKGGIFHIGGGGGAHFQGSLVRGGQNEGRGQISWDTGMGSMSAT